MKQVSTLAEFDAILKANPTVIVDFTACVLKLIRFRAFHASTAFSP